MSRLVDAVHRVARKLIGPPTYERLQRYLRYGAEDLVETIAGSASRWFHPGA
jgi:hypothetical protein